MLSRVNSASPRQRYAAAQYSLMLPIPTRIEMKCLVIALLAILPAAVARGTRSCDYPCHGLRFAGGAALSDATVVIRHGVISGVGQHLRTPKGIETIDCHGCVVLAGFWNAHVHFMEPKWNDAAHQPAEKLARQMSEMLTHSGFTTVVDTGSDGENTIALRRRVESGEFAGPRIFTAGIPIFPAHALPYYLADLPPELKAKMAQPETPAEAATFVDKNRAAGSDIVKLFTGSIVRPGSHRSDAGGDRACSRR